MSKTAPRQIPRLYPRVVILLLVASVAISAAQPATRLNNGWRSVTTSPPRYDLIRLNLGGSPQSLDDPADAIVEHFRSRRADPFLGSKLSSMRTSENVRRGLALRSGKLKLGGLPEFAVPTDFAWSENPFHDRNWAWRLHCLEPLQFLLAANAQTGSEWFLAKSEALITDWIQDNYSAEAPSEFSWSDHSTAVRLQNLLCAFERVRAGSLAPESIIALLGSLHAHASVLGDPDFYLEHTNHGLDQSCSLFLTGAAFPEFEDAERWRALGKERIMSELAFAFTSEGVHVENSPGYHFLMLRRALEVETMLQHYCNADADAELLALLGQGFRFAAHVLRPDGTTPILGDTQALPVADHPSYHLLAAQPGYQEFLFSVSQGRLGVQPQETVRVFPLSGYATIRSSWSEKDFSKALHLVLKAGFLSTYHRHDDDLSFVLYAEGEDWIIDSGLYLYQEQDPLRRYVRSAEAHNVPIIDDLTQGRSPNHRELSQIEGFHTENGNATIQAAHSLYPGVTLTRTLTYRQPGTVTLHDHLQTEEPNPHTFRILFHVPQDKIITLKGRNVTVRSLRGSTRMDIRVLGGSVESVRSIVGQQEPRYQGWTSPTYGERVPSICLAFEGQGTQWDSTLELCLQPPLEPSPTATATATE